MTATKPSPRPVGRPREPNARRITLGVRVQDAERVTLEAAAAKAGMTFSAWARIELLGKVGPCATSS